MRSPWRCSVPVRIRPIRTDSDVASSCYRRRDALSTLESPDMNLTHTCSIHCSSKPPETPIVHVVDGDASVHESLEGLIRSAGWEPRAAASAEEFLARPRVMSPNCLLVELRLPGASGLDLQRFVSGR